MEQVEYALIERRGESQLEIILPREYVELITSILNLRKDHQTDMYAMDSIDVIRHRYGIES